MSTENTAVQYTLSADLLADWQALTGAVDKAANLRAQVDETAARIPGLQADADRLTSELREREADRALAEDGEVKKIEAEIKKVSAEVDAKTRELNRARSLVETLEARAPASDEAVRAAASVLERSLMSLADDLLQDLQVKLREQVKPLQGVLAALKVVAPHAAANVRDIVAACYVPEPDGFMRIITKDGWANMGTNLLEQQPEGEHGALAAGLSELLAPVRQSLQAAKAHAAYVPLSKRPKPYERKGYTTEGVKGDQRPFGGEKPNPQAAPVQPSTPKGLSRSTGRVRVGYAGQPAPGTPIDGEMGHQLVGDLMRTHGGSEFAV